MPKNKITRTYKEVLGFTSTKDPVIHDNTIIIFKGDTYPHLDWFRQSPARYSQLWGWYFISTEPLPSDLPADLEPYYLPWDAIAVSENEIKSEDTIKSAVEAILYPETEGEWVGSIGERIQVFLTVLSATQYAGSYGTTTYHTFADDLGNRYVWNTASKTLIEGETYNMRGTIKDLTQKRGHRINILTRCSILK